MKKYNRKLISAPQQDILKDLLSGRKADLFRPFLLISSGLASLYYISVRTFKYAGSFFSLIRTSWRKLRNNDIDWDTEVFLAKKQKERDANPQSFQDIPQITKSSYIRKKQQHTVRFLAASLGIIFGAVFSGVVASIFIAYLAPVVGVAAAGTLGTILSAIFLARSVIFVVKQSERLYNKLTSGKPIQEIYAMDDIRCEEMAEKLGVGRHFFQRPFIPRWLRALHLHWSSGDTNPIAGYNSWLKDGDEEVIYSKRQSHSIWFHLAGTGVGIGLGFLSIVVSPFLTVAPWVIILGMGISGLLIGDRIAGAFMEHDHVPSANRLTWLGVTIVVATVALFCAVSLAWPILPVIAAVMIPIAILSTAYFHKEYTRKNKDETHIFKEPSAISVLIKKAGRDNSLNKEMVLSYTASLHKEAFEAYQKNAAKLKRHTFIGFLVQEITKAYVAPWKDIRKYTDADPFFTRKRILKGFINYVARPVIAPLISTGRVILSLAWIILPFHRLYEHGKYSVENIRETQTTVGAILIGTKRVLMTPLILVNPLYGTLYDKKQNIYLEKKAENKERMQHAEETHRLILHAGEMRFTTDGQKVTGVTSAEGNGHLNRVNTLLSKVANLDDKRAKRLIAKREQVQTKDAVSLQNELPDFIDNNGPDQAKLSSIRTQRLWARFLYYTGNTQTHPRYLDGKVNRLDNKLLISVPPNSLVPISTARTGRLR